MRFLITVFLAVLCFLLFTASASAQCGRAAGQRQGPLKRLIDNRPGVLFPKQAPHGFAPQFYYAAPQSIPQVMPSNPIPPCGCGCMQTGSCTCKNCAERTADPNWRPFTPGVIPGPTTGGCPGGSCPLPTARGRFLPR